VLIPAGYALAGFPGAVCGFALADVVRLLVSMVAARPTGIRRYGQDLKMSCLVAASALIGALACDAVAVHVPAGIVGTLLEALTIAVTVSLAWLPFALSYLSWRRRREPRA
jgi:hypothetical protein